MNQFPVCLSLFGARRARQANAALLETLPGRTWGQLGSCAEPIGYEQSRAQGLAAVTAFAKARGQPAPRNQTGAAVRRITLLPAPSCSPPRCSPRCDAGHAAHLASPASHRPTVDPLHQHQPRLPANQPTSHGRRQDDGGTTTAAPDRSPDQIRVAPANVSAALKGQRFDHARVAIEPRRDTAVPEQACPRPPQGPGTARSRRSQRQTKVRVDLISLDVIFGTNTCRRLSL